MKMREYVDAIQGAGSWDHIHDCISRMDITGWSLPSVEVDGRKVNIFPGSDREITLDAIKTEIRRVLAQIDGADGSTSFDEALGRRQRVHRPRG